MPRHSPAAMLYSAVVSSPDLNLHSCPSPRRWHFMRRGGRLAEDPPLFLSTFLAPPPSASRQRTCDSMSSLRSVSYQVKSFPLRHGASTRVDFLTVGSGAEERAHSLVPESLKVKVRT